MKALPLTLGLMTIPLPLAHASFRIAAAPAPIPAKQPRDVSVHGDPRTDDYFWLRERESPAVRAYLEQENAYTEQVLAPAAALREQLFREMRGRIQETDSTVPVSFLGWLYYTRTEQDRQYPIHCRRADQPGAPEQILLDLNRLAEGRDYVALGHWEQITRVAAGPHTTAAYSGAPQSLAIGSGLGGRVLLVEFADTGDVRLTAHSIDGAEPLPHDEIPLLSGAPDRL